MGKGSGNCSERQPITMRVPMTAVQAERLVTSLADTDDPELQAVRAQVSKSQRSQRGSLGIKQEDNGAWRSKDGGWSIIRHDEGGWRIKAVPIFNGIDNYLARRNTLKDTGADNELFPTLRKAAEAIAVLDVMCADE